MHVLIHRCLRSHIFVALSILSLLASGKAMAQSYSVTNLGTLGGKASEAFGINNNGQIVGSSTLGTGQKRAFLWENGHMRNLGTLGGDSQANAINVHGQVVGIAGSIPFLWQKGVMSNLPGLDASALGAWGINDLGQIVGGGGGSWQAPAGGRAFLWQNGSVRDLGTLGFPTSTAVGINNNGEIVGLAGPFAGSLAFLWKNGIMSDLGTLPLGCYTAAHGINDGGQIVGEGEADCRFFQHALLRENGAWRDLGLIGSEGGAAAGAMSINNSGDAVGYNIYFTLGTRAIFWSNSLGLIDLNSLLPPNSGWVLRIAHSINDLGQIVGAGTFQGQARAFLLNPSTAVWISNISVSQVMSRGATISWNTNIPADSTVEYGTSTAYGKIAFSSTLTTSHSIQLTGLAPATLFHFRVRSTDAGGHTVQSGDGTFATFPGNQAIPQASISNLRRAGNLYFVDITMFNAGDELLKAATIYGAVLGLAASPSSPSLPFTISNLPSGQSQVFTMSFPVSAGASGVSTKLSIGGFFTPQPTGLSVGTFSFPWRVTLP